MKNIFPIITFIALFIASCGNPNAEQGWPEDLEGKKSFLAEKKKELKVIQADVKKLQEEIKELDPEAQDKRRLVTVAPISRKDYKHYVEIQGSIQSDEDVNAVSEVPGRITQLYVKEGQSISKGKVIAKIDLEQVDKQLAEVEKSLELARDVYSRQKRLWDQKIGSEIQFLQAKNNVERLEKTIESIAYQKTKSTVYAPISGVVEMVMTEAGEVASPGMPICRILNTNKIKVVAEVPENHLRAVKKGESVSIEFPALEKSVNAKVSLVGKTIHPQNRTFPVEARVKNEGGLMKPNLLALMKIQDDFQKDVIMVPLEIVQQGTSGQSFVFIKKSGPDGDYAEKVFVETGKSAEGEIIISKGLTGEEMLIHEGARSLSNKEAIKIITDVNS